MGGGEIMTEEDKQLIAEYMGWELSVYSREYYYIPKNGKVVYFDLNDTGLCVAEMQKRGEWGAFMNHTWIRWSAQWRDSQASQEFVLHLFNAENFFNAMTEWLKERGK